MDTLKATVAANIAALRQQHGMTQLMLAEKLNYTDKAVSKWERGESIPDVLVLKSIADLFGVTVDDLLKPHTSAETIAPEPRVLQTRQKNRRLIAAICIFGVWCITTLVFVVTGILGAARWQSFVLGVPICLIVLLVLDCVWWKHRHLLWILTALLWALLLCFFLVISRERMWLLFLLGLPAQIIILLSCRLKPLQR